MRGVVRCSWWCNWLTDCVHMNDIYPPIISLTDGGYRLPSTLLPPLRPSQELDITLGVGSNIRRFFLFCYVSGGRLSWEVFVRVRAPLVTTSWMVNIVFIAFPAYLWWCKSLLSVELRRDILELRGFKNDNTKYPWPATFISLSIAHNLPTRLEIL